MKTSSSNPRFETSGSGRARGYSLIHRDHRPAKGVAGSFRTLLLCAMMAIAGATHAQTSTPPTGLLDPTPDEQQWLDATFPEVLAVQINALALQRVNADRLTLGLRELKLAVVPLGSEPVLSNAPIVEPWVPPRVWTTAPCRLSPR
jgi:hypothetical protein